MTLNRTKVFLTSAAGLLGLTHLALSALMYPAWSVSALWFVGSGVAIVIGAASNLVAYGAQSGGSRHVLVAINVTMAGFFIAAWTVLPGPQVIVGGALFAGLAWCAWKNKIQTAELEGQN